MTNGEYCTELGYQRPITSSRPLISDHGAMLTSIRGKLFLSHLLVAGYDRGVRISVRSFARLSTIYVEYSIKVDCSVTVTAASVKPCIVIVLDIPLKHAL